MFANVGADCQVPIGFLALKPKTQCISKKKYWGFPTLAVKALSSLRGPLTS